MDEAASEVSAGCGAGRLACFYLDLLGYNPSNNFCHFGGHEGINRAGFLIGIAGFLSGDQGEAKGVGLVASGGVAGAFFWQAKLGESAVGEFGAIAQIAPAKTTF